MPEERQAADFALRLIQDRYERELKKGINQLSEPEVQARITRDVEEAMAPRRRRSNLGRSGRTSPPCVRQVTAKVVELTIEIPGDRGVADPRGGHSALTIRPDRAGRHRQTADFRRHHDPAPPRTRRAVS